VDAVEDLLVVTVGINKNFVVFHFVDERNRIRIHTKMSWIRNNAKMFTILPGGG
jgi:hypothetical protein